MEWRLPGTGDGMNADLNYSRRISLLAAEACQMENRVKFIIGFGDGDCERGREVPREGKC